MSGVQETIAIIFFIAFVLQLLYFLGIKSTRIRRWGSIALASIIIFVPISDLSLRNYILSLMPFFSVGSIAFFAVLICFFTEKPLIEKAAFTHFCIWNVIVGMCLYLSSLGFVNVDFYYLGYGFSWWFIVVALITIGLFLKKHPLFIVFFGYIIAFNLKLSFSHNFFDYIVDPLVVILSLGTLLLRSMRWLVNKKFITRLESLILPLVFSVTITGVFWSRVDAGGFRKKFIKEDGVVEWSTVIGLALMLFVCLFRIIYLRRHKPIRFLLYLAFFAFLFFFAAGEEISWGQRILGFESPEFFQKYNSQKETNLHNLVFYIGERRVKVNKLVFGKILAIIIIIYFAVFIYMYIQERSIERFINDRAIPMPRVIHLISFILLFLLVQLIPSGKKGEILEFGGVFIFLCILIHPRNWEIFQKQKENT